MLYKNCLGFKRNWQISLYFLPVKPMYKEMVSIAAIIEIIQRIQSMPLVSATPSWVAAQVPIAAPTAPQIMVQRIEMF